MISKTRARWQWGFTLIELIVTLIVLGILAAVVLPRFANQLIFETRGFVDQTVATLQYARKMAVAAGRNVCVSASAGSNTLTMVMAAARGLSGDCVSGGTAVTNPAAKWRTYTGVTYGSLSMTFRGDGSAAAATFTVTGDGTYTIVVESTGYVHCSPVTACE